MIDGCTRILKDDKTLLGVLCISFLSNELFGITSELSNTQDAYPFLIDESGKNIKMLLNEEGEGVELEK